MGLSWIDALDTENPYFAVFKKTNEMGDCVCAEPSRRQVKCHWAIGKQTRGAFEASVEVCKPIRDRRLGRQYERCVGTCAIIQRWWLVSNAYQAASPSYG